MRALPGIVAGDGEAAAERFAGGFEAADVVALPAVERDRNLREPLEGRVGVDAERGVALAGGTRKRFEWRFVGHDRISIGRKSKCTAKDAKKLIEPQMRHENEQRRFVAI